MTEYEVTVYRVRDDTGGEYWCVRNWTDHSVGLTFGDREIVVAAGAVVRSYDANPPRIGS